MSIWRSEKIFLGRYVGGGVLNTVVGIVIIFLLMGLGVSPFIANICGYAVGLVLGFFVSKKIVFLSKGYVVPEGIRYLLAFIVCFILNLSALKFALDIMLWNAIFSQIFANIVYSSVMYLLIRWIVFRAGIDSQHHKI